MQGDNNLFSLSDDEHVPGRSIKALRLVFLVSEQGIRGVLLATRPKTEAQCVTLRPRLLPARQGCFSHLHEHINPMERAGTSLILIGKKFRR